MWDTEAIVMIRRAANDYFIIIFACGEMENERIERERTGCNLTEKRKEREGEL